MDYQVFATDDIEVANKILRLYHDTLVAIVNRGAPLYPMGGVPKAMTDMAIKGLLEAAQIAGFYDGDLPSSGER